MSDKETIETARKNEVDDDLAKSLPPDILKGIENADPDDREMMIAAAVRHIQYEGPLPPGYMLREYEDVLPGAADRIFRMAEQQAEHRQRIEKQAIESKSKAEMVGVVFAGLIVLSAVIGGIAAICTGHSLAGLVSLVSGIGGIASTFIYGTRSERMERAEKRKQRDS